MIPYMDTNLVGKYTLFQVAIRKDKLGRKTVALKTVKLSPSWHCCCEKWVDQLLYFMWVDFLKFGEQMVKGGNLKVWDPKDLLSQPKLKKPVAQSMLLPDNFPQCIA
jgi:hypothetical protein